jgi:diphthine methyl ester synthase
MSIPTAVSQLLEVESARTALATAKSKSTADDDDEPTSTPALHGALVAEHTLAISVSRLGSSSQKFHCGTLADLNKLSEDNPESFGPPLHSLVIIGKRLHDLEVKYMEAHAVDRENWRKVAQEEYGVKFED